MDIEACRRYVNSIEVLKGHMQHLEKMEHFRRLRFQINGIIGFSGSVHSESLDNTFSMEESERIRDAVRDTIDKLIDEKIKEIESMEITLPQIK